MRRHRNLSCRARVEIASWRPRGRPREIDLAVRDLVARGFGRALDILKSRRADLENGVELLLSKESLTVDDFPALRPMAGAARAEPPAAA
jgi:cell division protease FtsH